MNTSYSALDAFRSCPLKYKYQQIDKIKTPKSPEAVFGTVVHDTMKFIHSGQFLLPREKEALHHFSTHWNSEVFEDEIKERSAFAQGVRIIQQYYRKNDPEKSQIVALESRFTIEIEDQEKKENHLISGFIDRIDKTEDGFEIIDYKTSKKMPPQESVEDNLQLLIYLLAFLKRYPQEKNNLDKIKVSLYFLHHGAKLSATLDEEKLKKGQERVLEVINKIAESDFPPNVTPLCDWCGYQKNCPMWKHRFKEEKRTKKEEEKIISEYLKLDDELKAGRKKMGELKEQILEIMETEELERLFGEDRIIGKTHRQTFGYDEKKVKEILKERWEEVVKLDQRLLKKTLETLPSSMRKEVEKERKLKSESWGLSVRKK